jgi:homoserine kinase
VSPVTELPTSVTVSVPGSSANLGPGFDCLAAALPLYLTVSVARYPGPLSVVVTGEGEDEIAPDATNLVVSTLLGVVGGDGAGLEIVIENELPLQAGCGSSGAAIVAGVAVGDALRGRPLDRASLLRRAAGLEGHPDNVAASVYGGFTISHGDPIGAASVRPPDGLTFVLVTPAERLATSAARAVLPTSLCRDDAVFNLQRTALLVAAAASGDLPGLGFALADRLHEPHRAALLPTFGRLAGAAAELGALGVTLSGAGPSVLVWTTEAAAPGVAERIRTREPAATVRVLRPTGDGVVVRASGPR